MGLERYRDKRDFRATPEPRGRVVRSKAKALAFVVQKHAASHLHYDFRLELNGVLLSWAVPKGPSLDPHDKRLAMQVEDHPLKYGGFEGIIPPRQYGSGTVMVWDRGTWHPVGDPGAGYAKGHLKFDLDGEKLKGRWALIRTHGSKYGGKSGKQAWLLIKESDEHAKEGRAARIVDEAPDSVVSGRSLEAIARDKGHEWHSNRSVAANVRAGALGNGGADQVVTRVVEGLFRRGCQRPGRAMPGASASPASAAGAKKVKMPATLSPMLATLVDSAPTGEDWVHEVKFDGYRMVCRIDHGDVHVYSRNGKEWTAALPSVVASLQQLDVDQAWLDGEIAVADAKGRTSFQALQNALSDPRAKNITYFVFDLALSGRLRSARCRVDRAQALVAHARGRIRPRAALQHRRARLRRRILQAGLRARARRRGVEARRFDLSRRRSHARLGQGEVRQAAGNGDRRLHRPAGQPQRVRRAAAGHLRRRASCAMPARWAPDSTTRR